MTLSSENSRMLRTWIAQRREGRLATDDGLRLRTLLAANADARRMYAGYNVLQALLELEIAAAAVEKEASQPPTPIATSLLETHRSDTVWPSPLSYFSTGWPMAYLLATVIMASGLLTCAYTYVSRPTETANHTTTGEKQNSQSPIPNSSPKAEIVGRITKIADCVWAPGARDTNLKYVSLGERFDVRSGLLEITYDTGAKVILQGPVTYEVESAAGGYLAVGKLTARVEKKKEFTPPLRNPESPLRRPHAHRRRHRPWHRVRR